MAPPAVLVVELDGDSEMPGEQATGKTKRATEDLGSGGAAPSTKASKQDKGEGKGKKKSGNIQAEVKKLFSLQTRQLLKVSQAVAALEGAVFDTFVGDAAAQ